MPEEAGTVDSVQIGLYCCSEGRVGLSECDSQFTPKASVVTGEGGYLDESDSFKDAFTWIGVAVVPTLLPPA